MSVLTVLMLLLMGCGGGFLAGLLGVGGGMVLVPFLVMIFDAEGMVAPERLVQTALATALATIMFTSLSSMRAHHRTGAVQWPLVLMLAPGILLGGQLGSRVVAWLPGQALSLVFALFVGWSASRMLRGARQVVSTGRPLPGRLGLMAVGTGIGILSALFGAGGGFITVPFLAGHGVPMPKAVATSAACGFPIAVSGTLGYMVLGWWQGLPGGVLAFLEVPALLTIVPMSMLFAPLGAHMAHRLPVPTLKRLFACLLIVLAVYMLVRGLRG